MEIVTMEGSDDLVVEEFRRWLAATPRAVPRRRIWARRLSEHQCMAFVNALFRQLQEHDLEEEPVAWVGEAWMHSRGWVAHVWVDYREHRLEASDRGATISPILDEPERRRRRRRRPIPLEAYRRGMPIRWLEPSMRWLQLEGRVVLDR